MAMARLGVALSCLASAAAVRNFTVAAYLPEWRYEGANFASMSRTVTQLILFSLEVQPTGRLSAYADRLPRAELMLEARAATKAAGTQLLVCVGGNGRSAGFSAAVAKPDVQKRFVDNAMDSLIGSPEDMKKTIAADRAKWAEVIQGAGIRAD